jgi:hypothetical protein
MGRSRKWSALFNPSYTVAIAVGDDLTGALTPATSQHSPQSAAPHGVPSVTALSIE